MAMQKVVDLDVSQSHTEVFYFADAECSTRPDGLVELRLRNVKHDYATTREVAKILRKKGWKSRDIEAVTGEIFDIARANLIQDRVSDGFDKLHENEGN